MRELTDIHIPFVRRRVGRFLFLLITIVLTFLLRPLLTGFVSLSILMGIFFTAVLVSAVYAVSEKRSHFIVALVFVVPALTLGWLRYLLGIPSFQLVGRLSGGVFVAYALVLMLSHILSDLTPLNGSRLWVSIFESGERKEVRMVRKGFMPEPIIAAERG